CNSIGDSGATGLASGIGQCQKIRNLTLNFLLNYFQIYLRQAQIERLKKQGYSCILNLQYKIGHSFFGMVYHRIGDSGATGLVTGIGQCQNITNLTLNLHCNSIGDSGATGLATEIGQCQNIINLDLNFSENSIGDSGATGLATEIGQCQNIINLDLNL
ncbi:hypothetical protein ABPG72_020861, partial [Tetrahymena utriculariae]